MVFGIAYYSINRSDVICLSLGLPNTCGLSTSPVSNICIMWVWSFWDFKQIIYKSSSSFLTFLFVRNGDIEFQKLSSVKGWSSVDFAKYCFLAVFVRFVHLFFICLRAKKVSLDGHLLCLFLILDLVIIALPSSFVIRGVWFPLTCFIFSGAWLFKVDQKMSVKSSYLTLPLHSLVCNLFSNSHKKSLVSKYLKLL